jgi:hypothetical protein
VKTIIFEENSFPGDRLLKGKNIPFTDRKTLATVWGVFDESIATVKSG